jgi:hypothetical protein
LLRSPSERSLRSRPVKPVYQQRHDKTLRAALLLRTDLGGERSELVARQVEVLQERQVADGSL